MFYLELVKMNKPGQIIKTIKQKVFHFERPLERFDSHQKKKKKNSWHLYVFLKFPSYYCPHLIYAPGLDSIT